MLKRITEEYDDLILEHKNIMLIFPDEAANDGLYEKECDYIHCSFKINNKYIRLIFYQDKKEGENIYVKKTIIEPMYEYSRLVHNYLPTKRSTYDNDDELICGFRIEFIEYSDIDEIFTKIKNGV